MEGVVWAAIREGLIAFGPNAIGYVGLLIVIYLLVRQVNALWTKVVGDRELWAEKYSKQVEAWTTVIERNTTAHTEASKTTEARALALQRLADTSAAQDHRLNRVAEATEDIHNDLKELGKQLTAMRERWG